MIIVGIVAQFVTLFVTIMLYLARKGKTLPLRKLKSLKAIDEVVGRCAEMGGRPILASSGIGSVASWNIN